MPRYSGVLFKRRPAISRQASQPHPASILVGPRPDPTEATYPPRQAAKASQQPIPKSLTQPCNGPCSLTAFTGVAGGASPAALQSPSRPSPRLAAQALAPCHAGAWLRSHQAGTKNRGPVVRLSLRLGGAERAEQVISALSCRCGALHHPQSSDHQSYTIHSHQHIINMP